MTRTESGVRPATRRTDAEAALRALRAGYARALPDRVEHLARSVRAWEDEPADTQRFDEARILAHRLRGTVGSYGLVEAGARIGEVEDALLRAAFVYGETGAKEWEELDAAVCVAQDHALAARHALDGGEEEGGA